MRRRDRGRVRDLDHLIDDAGNEGGLDPRPADALDPRGPGAGGRQIARTPGIVKGRVLDIDDAKPRLKPAIADIAPDRGRGAAGAGAHHHPFGFGKFLKLHLLKDAFGDIVVAAPIGCALGIGELVQIMPARVRGDPGRDLIDLGWLIDQFAAPAKAPDRRQLGLAGGFGHDRDKGQAQKIGEIGLGDGGRTRRGFDQRGAAPDAAVADAVKKQRPRQPVLEAAGRMRAFILEIDRDIGQALKRRLDQMRVSRAVAVALENGDGIACPCKVHLLGRGEFGDLNGHIVCHDAVSGAGVIGSDLTRGRVKRPGVGGRDAAQSAAPACRRLWALMTARRRAKASPAPCTGVEYSGTLWNRLMSPPFSLRHNPSRA